MLKTTKNFLITFIAVFSVFTAMALKNDTDLNLYVSPAGNDVNTGKIASPFRTINKAQAYLRSLDKGSYAHIVVNLRGGVYKVTKPIIFTIQDSGTESTPIEYKAYTNEAVTISGGKVLPKQWVLSDKGNNIWTLKVGTSLNINQLFANGKRLNRSSSLIYYTTGPISKYAAQIQRMGHYNFKELPGFKQQNLLAFCSFSYNAADLNYLDDNDVDDIELLLYESWDCSWHKVSRIDKTDNSIYLRSPTNYQIGFFADKTRFTIENSKKDLKKPGDWCYSKKTSALNYVAKPGENPNNAQFVTPDVNELMIIEGDEASGQKVNNIKFTGINFKYTIAPRGILIDRFAKIAPSDGVPGYDLSTGFSAGQANFACGQTVQLKSVKNIVFNNCNFSNLGNYALSIDKYSDNNKVLNSSFTSLGGGGVILGYYNTGAVADGIPPSGTANEIQNCNIHDVGLIYMSSVGIGVMNANNSIIANNEIYNTPYSGISVGWVWGTGKSYTWQNKITGNTIHHVLRSLADGGGIYLLGSQPNTVIKGNIIHDIYQPKGAIGANNNAIFFDQGSAGMYIEENTSYNIQNESLRYNVTQSDKMQWGINKFKN